MMHAIPNQNPLSGTESILLAKFRLLTSKHQSVALSMVIGMLGEPAARPPLRLVPKTKGPV